MELRVARAVGGTIGGAAGGGDIGVGTSDGDDVGSRQMRTEEAKLIQSFWVHLSSSQLISCSMPLSARRLQPTTLPEYQVQAVKSPFA